MIDAATVAPHAPSASCVENAQVSGSPIGGGYRIGDYEIQSEIARGSMGVVYRAWHAGLGRSVALKMIVDANVPSELARRRFMNEAQAAAALDHPGIVPVYDVGTHEGSPYFTMALVQGESLAARLQRGPLTVRQATQIAEQIARAAACAHQHRIVHRDLKPANVLLDENELPHVTDFGVSKSLEADCDLTSIGEVVGTPHYMPPEQASGDNDEVGPSADIYAIGAILYAMLTGRPPFQAATPVEVISQVLSQTPVAPSALTPNVPTDVETITLKCLSKNSAERYADANQLGDDLQRYLRGEPIHARPPGWWFRLRHLVRRHVVWASVSGSAALMLVVLTTIVTWMMLHARARVIELENDLADAQQDLQSGRAIISEFVKRVGNDNLSDAERPLLELLETKVEEDGHSQKLDDSESPTLSSDAPTTAPVESSQ